MEVLEQRTMIKIQVMEKNGAPRELVFDKKIVTIGRSARNDVILPRNNVSKNHVTIELSKDRCIITDMGSTNGTFINGQRVQKPTVVGPEDKIFVSDFTIKAWNEDEDIPEELSGVHEIIEPGPDDDLEAKTMALEGAKAIRTLRSSPTLRPAGPPPLPAELPPMQEAPRSIHDFETKKISKEKRKKELEKLAAAAPAPEPSAPAAARVSAARISPKPSSSAVRELCAEMFKQISETLQIEKMDILSLSSEEFRKTAGRVIAQVLDTAVDRKSLPPMIEPRELSERLQSEVLGLGPLDEYLSSSAAKEVTVLPSGKVILLTSEGTRYLPDPFLTPESKALVLRKLLLMAGGAALEGEPVVTGSLEYGTSVKIVSPPLSTNGQAASIQKPTVLSSPGMAGLTANDILSDKMGKLLEICLQMRKGILVADPLGLSHQTLVPALATVLPQWERVAVVQCGCEPLFGIDTDLYFKLAGDATEVLSLSKSTENLLGVIPSFQSTALFIGELHAPQMLRMARMVAGSKSIVVATVKEPGPLDLLERLRLLTLSDYPQLDGEAALRLAAEGFGLVVSYAKMIDGTEKVTSISDIQTGKDGVVGLKPVFLYDMKDTGAGGQIIGTFRATKAIPTFIDEKRQKGGQVDTSLFQ
jgi:pilus assembly protein CpaF